MYPLNLFFFFLNIRTTSSKEQFDLTRTLLADYQNTVIHRAFVIKPGSVMNTFIVIEKLNVTHWVFFNKKGFKYVLSGKCSERWETK